MKPAALISTPSITGRRSTKNPDAASCTGVTRRATRQAARDMIALDSGQFFVPPPGTYRLPTTTSAPVSRSAAMSAGTRSGGWLTSASITPSTSPSATAKPAMTALPRPSLPARCTTRTGNSRASWSASPPVPSGELSSTMMISASIRASFSTRASMRTKCSSRSRSL